MRNRVRVANFDKASLARVGFPFKSIKQEGKETNEEEAKSYLLCGFAVVGSSRYRHQGRPVLQKHLPLTHIAPDPERCQVHSQVVLLSLKETHSQSFKGVCFK